MNETWPEMRARHKKEQLDLVRGYAKRGFTQTESADRMDWTMRSLNSFVIRNKIDWPVIRRGNKSRKTQEPAKTVAPKPAPRPMTKMEEMAAAENAAMQRRL